MSADGDGPMGPTRMRLSKPVIAAVAGHAVAGGLELALWCDLRVAEEGAVFGVFCRRWGVPLIDGGTVRLPRLIGVSRAMDMVLTGRGVPAREALEMGLANRVVPDGESLAAAQALARELAALPQTCLREDRLSLLEQEGLDEAAALANELGHGVRVARGRPGRARAVPRRRRPPRLVRLGLRQRSGPGEQPFDVVFGEPDRRVGRDQQRRPGRAVAHDRQPSSWASSIQATGLDGSTCRSMPPSFQCASGGRPSGSNSTCGSGPSSPSASGR